MLRAVLLLCCCAAVTPLAQAQSLKMDGQWEQGGLIVGRTDAGAQVWFNEQALPVSSDGVFVFGFHRDDPALASIRVRDAQGHEHTETHSVAQRDYPVQRIDGLPDKMVTPPKAVLDRIADDANRVKAARSHELPRTDFADGFVWPVQGPLSSVYGSQRVLNGVPRQPHYGVDIAVPTGTPIVASAGGVVEMADPDLYYTGGTVIIDHGAGVSSTYLHMSRLDVKPGQEVKRGQTIGAVGATGRVTGPHLCFRYNWRESRLDPQLLLPKHGEGATH